MVPGARKSFASVAPAPAPGGTSQTNLIGHRRTSAISAELFPMYVLPLKRLRDLYGAYDSRKRGFFGDTGKRAAVGRALGLNKTHPSPIIKEKD